MPRRRTLLCHHVPYGLFELDLGFTVSPGVISFPYTITSKFLIFLNIDFLNTYKKIREETGKKEEKWNKCLKRKF